MEYRWPAAASWVGTYDSVAHALWGEVGERAGPCVVLVDGGAGSGKTTLANRLFASLQVRAQVPATGRHPEPVKVELDDWNWWRITGAQDIVGFLPRFTRELLLPLVKGHTAVYYARDRANDEMGESLEPRPRTAFPAPLILIEGVGAACRELTTFLEARHVPALTIYVTADPRTRKARGLARPGTQATEKDWDDWQVFERQFFILDGTIARCHLIVDGDLLSPVPQDRFVVIGGTATEARLRQLGLTPLHHDRGAMFQEM